MPANDFRFTTHWRVESIVAEVAEILANAPDLARWWPSVYLEVRQLEPGDATSEERARIPAPPGPTFRF